MQEDYMYHDTKFSAREWYNLATLQSQIHSRISVTTVTTNACVAFTSRAPNLAMALYLYHVTQFQLDRQPLRAREGGGVAEAWMDKRVIRFILFRLRARIAFQAGGRMAKLLVSPLPQLICLLSNTLKIARRI